MERTAISRRRFAAIAVLGALTFSGCATQADPRAERGTGVAASYAAPVEAVWAALPELARELGLRLVARDEAAGMLRLEGGGSFGDGATVFVERLGTRGNSRVEVVPARTLGIDLSLGDLPKDIHNALARRFRRY